MLRIVEIVYSRLPCPDFSRGRIIFPGVENYAPLLGLALADRQSKASRARSACVRPCSKSAQASRRIYTIYFT
ncbi:MAG: hypothetical protein COV72_04850 [Candidatus Omnitrophica bacterium CG11_big_fil_rev_8_21_14_0_20_42_13]|uniref:Uncharacterized protein n=1 Tax=Candidatus Ghiorseimicrobium undicola TaxID=1974746 RepID=A0A2H0M066_9BACT|nr:MAG: hypothetical protein COV72_04850 [Candidatus Omnitrophica bacterium CG11_big_fil_rev_8_21_14_0_20_42_13]